MSRYEDGEYFGSALQIVDSQYYARLLQDCVGLKDYYNAYVHAKNRGLSSAAGCHFEELLHQLFRKRPNPIEFVLESTGTGAQGLDQLTEFLCYWIPSIPNFANIDALFVTAKQALSQCGVFSMLSPRSIRSTRGRFGSSSFDLY